MRLLALAASLSVGVVLIGAPASTAEEASEHRAHAESRPDHKVVVIDWDGLDPRYLDWADTPNIDQLIRQGSLSTATGTYKTISNPSRASMVTGAFPEVHENVAYVYDRDANLIRGQSRFLAAETIAQTLADEGKTVASVQWYMVENYGTEYGNPEHLYVQPGGACVERIDAAIDILHQRPVDSGGEQVTVPKIPDLLAVYCSDLDSLGHEDGPFSPGMVPLLEEMDDQLGRLIEATKDVGGYGHTTFMLVSDHGMTEWERTLSPQVLEALSDAGYPAEILYGSGGSPADETEVIISAFVRVGTIALRGDAATDEGRAEVQAALESVPGMDQVLDRDDLRELRASELEGDLVAETTAPWAFADVDLPPGTQRGSHASLAEIEVPLVVSGPRACPGAAPDNPRLVDVAPTISHLLGVRAPADAQGRALTEALREPNCQP